MSLGEQIFMRIAIILMIAAVVFVLRLVKSLIKKGWNALTGSGDRKKPPVQPSKPPVQPAQPPKPPVLPNTPAQPPVTPAQPVYTPPVPQPVQQPEYYEGTVPLGVDNTQLETPPAPQPGAKLPTYRLRFLSGEYQGRAYVLPEDDTTLGRNPGNNIIFAPGTPGVSGNHCKIKLDMLSAPTPEAASISLTLTDLGSTYGTYTAQGVRIPSHIPVTLKPGDTIYLGGQQGPSFVLEEV